MRNDNTHRKGEEEYIEDDEDEDEDGEVYEDNRETHLTLGIITSNLPDK